MAEAEIAALRERGAADADPLRFRYVQALARRAAAHEGMARAMLDAKLAAALAACAERCDAHTPPAASDDTPATTPLGNLLRTIEAAGTETTAVSAPTAVVATPASTVSPLKSLQHFGDHWARLGSEQQLAKALADAPANAGPLNSHRLVLAALERMRDVSPDYLHRFIAYADALCWLEDVELAQAATQAAAREKRGSPARGRR